MGHNKQNISAEGLFTLLKSISPFVERKIRMYALGGTALTILNIKRSTLDIDMNIDSHAEYTSLCKIFEQIGFEKTGSIRWFTQEGLAFDIFYGSNILGTALLPDCLANAKFIQSFGNIELYTLSFEDIIISKLARGDSRDFDDIKSILAHAQIDMANLIARYRKTMEVSIVSNYKQKLLDLIELKFREWAFPVDEKLLAEVKKWE